MLKSTTKFKLFINLLISVSKVGTDDTSIGKLRNLHYVVRIEPRIPMT